MRRAGHRVLGDAARRSKEPRHEIDAASPRRGGDDGKPIERGERGEIGRECGDIIGALVYCKVVARREECGGAPPERGGQRLGHRTGLWRAGWEIKRQQVAVARDGQPAGLLGLEGDADALGLEPVEDDKRRGQRRMPT